MRTLILALILCSAASSAQVCDPNTNSLRFNGASYVRFPSNNDLNISGNITVEAWIKVAAFQPNYVQGSIVCKHGWSQGEKGYVLRCGGNGILAFAIAGIDNGGNPVSWKEVKSHPGDIQLNKWQHVAGTYDGHKLHLYVDGNQVGSVNFMGSIDPSVGYDLKFGRIADDNTFDKRYFDGWIDDVRIWNTSLSKTDIQANMSQQIQPNAAGLVAYWEMNDGSGTSAVCAGSIHCTGTLVGAQWDVDVPYTNGIVRPVITSVANTLVSSSLTGNQWNLNGIPIPGETGITLTPTVGGDYSVTVNYGLGCTATSEVYTMLFAGIDEADKDFTFRNLGKGFYRVDYSGTFHNGKVSVMDISGKEVYSSDHPFDIIDLSGDSPGIYCLMLSFDDRAWRTKFVFTGN